MTSNNWSIEKEICDITKIPDLCTALRNIEILDSSDTLHHIEGISSWHRGGAETYVYEFEVWGNSGRFVKVIAKAMVSATLGTPPERFLEHWIRRRRKLSNAGCPVPKLFTYGKGLLIESFIPWGLNEYIRRCGASKELEQQIYWISECLADCGFRPVCILPNIRTDGKTLYWVDFGSDLGGESSNTSKEYTATLALREYLALQAHMGDAKL